MPQQRRQRLHTLSLSTPSQPPPGRMWHCQTTPPRVLTAHHSQLQQPARESQIKEASRVAWGAGKARSGSLGRRAAAAAAAARAQVPALVQQMMRLSSGERGFGGHGSCHACWPLMPDNSTAVLPGPPAERAIPCLAAGGWGLPGTHAMSPKLPPILRTLNTLLVV